VLLCGVVLRRLESYFQFAELKTSWRVEILAGFTTFLTMAYIVFVNPTILGEAGMPVRAVAAATCFSAACGSLLMGALARYPIALAPGMGLNAYFTYTVVQGMGVSWQVALGAVFLSGLAFLLLTLMGVRRMIVTALPTELYAAVAAGIGLFIAFIGLRNAGIVAADANTLVRLGDLHRGETLLSLIGLVLIAALMAWGIRAAMLIGIVATSVLGMLGGFVHWQPQPYSWHEITATALQLDVRGALQLGLLEIVFVFLFVDFFDNSRPTRWTGHFGGSWQTCRAVHASAPDSAHPAHPVRGWRSDHGGIARGHLDRGELHRKHRGSGGGRAFGSNGNRDGSAIFGGAAVRAAGRRDPRRSHSSCPDRGGRSDDGYGCGDQLERSGACGSGVPHDDHHSAHLQHRQRAGVRVHLVHAVAGCARAIPLYPLADVPADGAVPAALRVSGQRLMRVH
jgi:hypothetical protein